MRSIVLLLLAGWLALALIAGGLGLVARLRPPAPQLVLVGLVATLLVLERHAAWLRSWVAAVDLRGLLALHLTRFVGFAFLALGRRGELPMAFAVPAGWGDILVASFALLLLFSGVAPTSRNGRGLYQIWNAMGLLDLAFVVVTAVRLALTDPGSMNGLLRLPLSLLPTFLVPLLIASHVWMLRRLAAMVPQR